MLVEGEGCLLSAKMLSPLSPKSRHCGTSPPSRIQYENASRCEDCTSCCLDITVQICPSSDYEFLPVYDFSSAIGASSMSGPNSLAKK